MMRRLLGLLLVLIASAASAQMLMLKVGPGQGGGPPVGTIFYVDSAAGNNSNSGLTKALAWADFTPVNAHTTYHPGDQVLIKGGSSVSTELNIHPANYTTNPPTAANPLVISTYGTGGATINTGASTITNCIQIYDVGAVSISNITCTGTGTVTNTAVVYMDNDGLGAAQYTGVTLNNITVAGAYTGAGIAIGGDSGTDGFTNVAISNCSVTGTTAGGIQAYGTSSGYAHHNVNISNCVVFSSGNSSDANGSIVLGRVNGGSITNSISHNNTMGVGASIWAYASTGITIAFNESYNNTSTTDAEGFDFDTGMESSFMQYNYSHGNAGAGFALFQTSATVAWSNNIVRYNISQNDATVTAFGSITLGAPSGTFTGTNKIYNNTIYQGGGTSTSALSVYTGQGVASMSTFAISNNIFMVASGDFLFNPGGTFTPTWTMLDNNYCPISGSTCGGTFKLKWGATTYSTFSSWQSASGMESGATIASSWPALSNAGGGGTTGGYVPTSLTAYQLTHGSALIGVGLSITSPGAFDYFGDAIPNGNGTGYNVGADGANR